MELKRLASRFNFREVEKEWQFEFVFYVLSNLGIPNEILEGCFPEEGLANFTVDHKIELRKQLKKFDVTILDDLDGGIKIFVRNEADQIMVGEWKKCRFVYKTDTQSISNEDKVYTEVISDIWTIFDEEMQE